MFLKQEIMMGEVKFQNDTQIHKFNDKIQEKID